MNRQLICAALSGGVAVIICQAVLNLCLRKYRKCKILKEQSDASQEVQHHGSCRCARVNFEVMAPPKHRKLIKTSEGAFSGIRARIQSFELTSGQSLIFTYSPEDESESNGSATGSLAFCSFCGMNLLYSTSDPEWLEVNVDCLQLTVPCKNAVWENIIESEVSKIRETSQDGKGGGLISLHNSFPESIPATTYANFYGTMFSAELPDNNLRQSPGRMSGSKSGFNTAHHAYANGTQSTSPVVETSRLFDEVEWSQMYSSMKSLDKKRYLETDGYGEISGSGGKELPVERVGLTRGHGSGSFCSCESGGSSLKSRSGSFSNARTDEDVAESIFFEDEDSISVLSSRITSEGDTYSPPKTPGCSQKGRGRESAHAAELALKGNGFEMGSVAMESPHSMCEQLRVHLSRHLN